VFYVSGKKEVVFRYENGDRIVFQNTPHDGFKIETHGIGLLQQLPHGGPGTIRFRLPVEYPSTRVASRAVTKIAYLVLAVINPDIAFSDALCDVRTYLVDDHAPYCVYGELFCPQGPPRVSVSYWVTGRHIKADQCEIASIFAKILIHHVQYVVDLVGWTSTQMQSNPRPESDHKQIVKAVALRI